MGDLEQPPRGLEPWADRVLSRSPLQAIAGWRSRQRLPVLAYHAITDRRRFAAQLDWLALHMQPMGLEGALDAFSGRRPLPRRAVLVTFDDGDRSVLEIGLPLMRSRGIPGVVFVIAGLLDGDRPPWFVEARALAEGGGRADGLPENFSPDEVARSLKGLPDPRRRGALEELRRTATSKVAPWPQLRRVELRELEERGVAVGNHTATHPCLDRCDAETVEAEITEAHEILRSALGHPPQAFAYPNGQVHPAAPGMLGRLDYRAGFLFDHRLSPVPPADPFRISRLRVSSHTSLDRFRIILSGLHPALHRALGRS